MTSSHGLQWAAGAAATLFPMSPPPRATDKLHSQAVVPIRIGACRSSFKERLPVSVLCTGASSVINDEEASSSPESINQVSMNEEDLAACGMVGSKIRVKVPLKVHHVPKLGEIDITGREGVIKDFIGIWKGKRISANLPFKVEFQGNPESGGPAKFFAHLRDDEFDIVE